MALAMTGGSLVTASLAATPTSATSISLSYPSTSTDTVTITPSAIDNIGISGHSVRVEVSGDSLGYNVTLSTSGELATNAMTKVNPDGSSDDNKTLPSVAGTNQMLTDHTYGYTTTHKPADLINSDGSANDIANGDIWNAIPLAANPATLTPDTADTPTTGNITKDINITYGANVNSVEHGTYQAKVTYTATVTPRPVEGKPDICQSGNPDNGCQVDIDSNMIPVKYTDDSSSTHWEVADKDNSGWYNYTERQWANAVAVTDPTKYNNKVGEAVAEGDILGYWVYIPRYEYAVKSLAPSKGSEGLFDIRFRKSTDTSKTTPSATGDYVLHPAFRWGSEDINGFWIGKFETTGSTTNPTILPNQFHIGNMSSNGGIGGYYNIAKSLGLRDTANAYGTNAFTVSSYNTHHLNNSSTHMAKNSEWGATVYLAGSTYGAGVDGAVQTNGNSDCGKDGNNQDSCSKTGGDDYITNISQSTTGNQYGVYDMAGGANELVMGGYNSDLSVSGSDNMSTPAKPPYVDVYNFTDVSGCNWSTCGGHALYETDGWGSGFVMNSFVGSKEGNQWFSRGKSYFSSDMFVFNSGNNDGNTDKNYGFRTALLVP